MKSQVIRAMIVPMGTAAGSVLTFGMLAIASRDGQLDEIAGYASGLSIGALTAAVCGGGTSLTFVSGNTDEQRAVRWVRTRVVIPVIVLSVVFIGTAMALGTGLPIVAVLMGGLVAAANNASEVESAYLRRHLRTPVMVGADFAARSIGLGLVLLHIPFAISMAVVAIARFVGMLFPAMDDPSRRKVEWVPIRLTAARAYQPRLIGVAVLYAVIDRLPFLLAPVVAAQLAAGTFATVLTLQQSVAVILVTGLQVTFARQSETRTDLRWMQYFDGLLVAAALMFAVLATILYNQCAQFLKLPTGVEYHVTWVVLVFALPVAVLSRSLQFRRLARREPGDVLLVLLVVSVVLAVGGIAAVSLGRLEVLAVSVLMGEIMGCLTTQVVRRRRSKGSSFSESSDR